jgi:surface antigen
MKKIIMLVLTTSFLLTSCESNRDSGSLIGGVAGALVGSTLGKGNGRVAAAAGGAIFGSIIGSKVGASMDERDRQTLHRTTQNSLERSRSGETNTWQNPDSGHHGSVTPYKAYETRKGEYCREYSQTVTVAGKTEEAYGTACRQPDGSWKIVK